MSNVVISVGKSSPVNITTGTEQVNIDVGGSGPIDIELPSGLPGPGGPPGPPGEGVPAFTFVQSTPSDTWVIDHALGYKPNITVVDSAGSQVEGDVKYQGDVVAVFFSAAFAGIAYLS